MGTQPKTRYARNGDVRIAYQVVGDGPIDVVMTPGYVSHVDLWWMFPEINAFLRRLTSFSRLILYDKRGTGLSDPAGGLPALETRMEDLHAVLDDVGSERTALLGISEGGPMSILFAATYPDRVTALAVVASFARTTLGPDDSDSFRELRTQARAAFDGALENWGEGRSLDLLAPSFAGEEAVRRGYGMYERLSSSPAMAKALVDASFEIDVSHALPAITAPTLVVHRVGDRAVPLALGRDVAKGIAGAQMVELPGIDHVPWLGDFNEILDPIEEFFTGSKATRAPERALVTVVFTDIVSSTQRAAEVGDAAWSSLLEDHERLTHEAIDDTGGQIVKSLGDGYLLRFDGPARAIAAARKIVDEAPRRLGVEVRAGVHTGECELRADDLGGMAVHIGARVAARAAGGEVLVSRAVRDLVVGSPIGFSGRGEHELKGVPGRWELLAVETEGSSGVSAPAPPRAEEGDVAPNATEATSGDRAAVHLARTAPSVSRLMSHVAFAGARKRAARRRTGSAEKH